MLLPTRSHESSKSVVALAWLAIVLLLGVCGVLVRGQSTAIALVQHTGKDAGTTTSSSLAFTANNTAGNWIAVLIRAGGTGQAFTVSDTRGNTYRKAVQYNETVDGTTLGIFYAETIVGGANAITVTNTFSGTLRFAIMEYTGVASANSLDVTAAGQGTSNTPTTGSATTTTSGELVIGLISTANPRTVTAGSGYVIEERVPAAPNTKLAVEDRVQTVAGPASANGTLNTSDIWGAAMAAFRPATGGGGTGPGITNVSPASGTVGTAVTIAGMNFGATQGASTVRFNGTVGSPTSWGANSIAVPVPAGATTGPVVVTVNGTPSNGATFTVTSPSPSITSVSPASGTVGTSVTIAGMNFGATQGASTVRFNGTAGSPTSWGANSIAVPVPAGATTGPVVVTVNGTPSNGATFTVTSPSPSITSVSPASGAVGTSVTIAGMNFGATQGASTVRFNGTVGSPTTWGANSIAVPVPAGATTGPVVVTVNGAPSNGMAFTVTQSSDSQPPTAPGSLTATGGGGSQINLNWAPSTDNVGVTGYRVEQCEGAGCTNFTEIAQVSAAPAGVGPLVVSANPNYFKDAAGTPLILNGSHTWNNLQDWGTNGSLQTLDFNAFVNTLVTHGHNFTLLWYIELPKFCGFPTTAGTPPDFSVGPHPWQRTGPGNATDGAPKFDLTKYNQAYFDRLRTRVDALNNAGIYVGVYTFTAEWVGRYRCSTDGYPFTGVNNINGINDGGGSNSFTMSSPNAITAVQDAYVEKVIDTLNDFPNVLWMVSEEAPENSNWWNDHQIAHIRSYECEQALSPSDRVRDARGARRLRRVQQRRGLGCRRLSHRPDDELWQRRAPLQGERQRLGPQLLRDVERAPPRRTATSRGRISRTAIRSCSWIPTC